jgi:iron complex outermembrane receptor protein
LKWNTSNFNLSAAVFNRNSSHLIDYVKMQLTDPWQAQNIQDVTTKGFETQLLYSFNLNAFAQSYNLVILYSE